VRALLAAAGRDPRDAVSSDLGFAAGPRLNAAGRLDDMALGVECLLADDPAAAARMADSLSALNAERRDIEQRMQQEAMETVDALSARLGAGRLPVVVCLYEPHWHAGVVGLVASRIKDRFHRPVLAFAGDGEGGLKGSARSVRGLHIRDVLAEVDARHPTLIRRFGGHAMAAGLTLEPDGLEDFRAAVTQVVEARADAADLSGTLTTDGELEPERMDLATAQLLRSAAPWGQGFPEPTFDGCFRLREARRVGGQHLRCRLEPESGGRVVEAIAFRYGEAAPPPLGARVRVVFRLAVNDYQGVRSAQLLVDDLRAA
jgi:single-stranded-DNA-specific exonuclease